MNRDSHRRKKMVRGILLVVLLADVALGVLYWRGTRAPRELKREEDRLETQRKLLAAEVEIVESIRQRLPEVKRACDRFFTEDLREASSGYSSIVADLGGLAKKAGLRSEAVTFRQREIEGRNVLEVQVAATVEGDYSSLVRFVNGLERSSNFYLLDGLSLASSTGGSVKLNLQLRTFFRSS